MTQQIELTGMPQRLFRAAPARLTAWLDCPRRFRFSYVDRPAPPRGPAWAHSSFGTSIHTALKSWVSAPVERRTPDTARSLVDTSWVREGYRDDAQESEQRERAREMVAGYVATLDPRDEPAGVERTVAAKRGTLALEGRVDRIDRRGDELVVVDYKTGRAPLTHDDARGSLALAIYAVAAAQTLRTPCYTVELHHLPTGAVLSHTHTDESLDRQVRRAEAIADEIRAASDSGDYPARPGSSCQWCDFVRVCPEGREKVIEPRRPWDALPT